MTLKPPFPSSPSRPPFCELKITCEERDMMHVHSFGSAYSAKKMIEALIGDDDYKEINDQVIKTDRGIKIKSKHLIEVMNHKYSPEEKAWELPKPYPRMIKLFRGEAYSKEEDGALPIPKKAVMPTRVDKPVKEKKPRAAKPDGLITIQDICAEMKVEPSKARAALRKSNTPKPDHGWAWDAKGAEAIRKILKGVK
jgi:hypothetical protein